LAFALPQAAVAQPAPLAQVTAHLQAVDTMTANFSQTDRRGQVLNGVLTLKRPGRLRFQYQQGVPMLIVADGQSLIVEARDPKKPQFGTITLGFSKTASAPAGLLLQGWTVLDAQNNRTTV